MKIMCEIIPAHRRTVFVQFHKNDVQRFCLCIPQMCLYVQRSEVLYCPYKNKTAYYSPFVNTSSSGFVCMGETSLENWTSQGILNHIYKSVWHLDYETEVLGSWKVYSVGLVGDQHLAYFNFLKKWERTGKIDLVVNHHFGESFHAVIGTKLETI